MMLALAVDEKKTDLSPLRMVVCVLLANKGVF